MTVTTPTLANRIEELNVLLAQALAQTASTLAGPDNPAIKRVSGSLRVSVVSSSELLRSDNWTVFFHDWKAQYVLLQELLSFKKFAAIRTLLAGKTYADAKLGNIKLAPEVIAHVAPILGDLPV